MGQISVDEIPGVSEYLLEKSIGWQLEESDLTEMRIRDDYISSHTGARHIYINQQYGGIDVYNAIITLTLRPNGDVLTAFSRFVPELEQKIVGHDPVIAPIDAVLASFEAVGLDAEPSEFTTVQSRADGIVYSAERYSSTEIPVIMIYQPLSDGTVELAYDLSFDPHKDVDYWSIRVSALDGRVLDKVSWTVKCNMDMIPQHQHDFQCFQSNFGDGYTAVGQDGVVADRVFFGAQRLGLVDESSQYRVIPFPYESPLHGDFELVDSPYDEEFSPLGWHSISQGSGPDFTHTRGNNVHAFLDRIGNGQPDIVVDGGQELVFDFPFDQDWEPEDYREAAVTNLFYWNNILHDFSMAYGFDEASGNFQEVNLTGQGADGDAIRAIAQSAAETGTSLNNATFSSPPDGNNGTMRMYVWTRNSADASLLTVEEPAEIAGLYETGTATFGAPVSEDPIIAEAVLVDDEVGVPTDGCEEIKNDINGKIAIIDRGICEFGLKVFNAEQKGAIAVIICNNRAGGVVTMAPGAVGDLATIPSVFISQEDCNIIRQYAGDGLKIKLQRPNVGGPSQYDASFDNGIIAHEFAHGVSIRLTGGPSSSGCLVNVQNGNRSDGQQMGEGWSDFFSLITGVREGDTKNTNRGIGNYVIRASTDSRGIRAYPYNYSMSANPVTYYDTYDASVPHGVGHVWGSMLWDLVWEMVEVHGFDPDWYRGTGGNNMAVQLVMDGMKLQPCNPGFVDGRDAILAADELLYGGANQCLIWRVFARRGLGLGAEQGDPFRVRDAKESYEVPPTCLATVKVTKEVTPTIEAGEQIEVELIVVSHKEENPSGVEVRDQIPQGASVVMSSLPANASIDGNEVVFVIGDLEYDQPITLSYSLDTDPALFSKLRFLEDNEGDAFLKFLQGGSVGTDIFEMTTFDVFSGQLAWFVPNTSRTNVQNLIYVEPLEATGEFPVMRVAHRYNTEHGTDGGIIRISNDNLESYIDLGYAMFRQEYPNRISGATFSQGNIDAFSGNSDGWVQTYIDLSDFKGEQFYLDFQFGSDDNNAVEGWYIDDIEIFEAFNYHTEVQVFSDQGLEASAFAQGRGTIVQPQLPTNVETEVTSEPEISVFPNPTSGSISLIVKEADFQDAKIELIDISGRRIYQRKITTSGGFVRESIDMSQLSAGVYHLSIITSGKTFTERVVKF